MKVKSVYVLFACFFFLCLNSSCKTIIANALTGEGSSTVFTGDPDPELVGDALPFAIKIYETLVESNPKHRGLLLFTGSLFVMYSNAFVQGPADMLPANENKLQENEKNRAKKLYLRGLDLLYRGIEVKYKGFSLAAANAFTDEAAFENILKKCKKEDTGFLYWAAAGGMAAYSIDQFDFDLNARIPEWKAMALRAYELNPDFGGASLDEFLFILYGSLPVSRGGDVKLALEYYQKAMDKTQGKSASALIALAEMISSPQTFADMINSSIIFAEMVSSFDVNEERSGLFKEYLDKVTAIKSDDDNSSIALTEVIESYDVTEEQYELFKEYLEKALAINPDEDESSRLVTIINQRKARWLLDNAYINFSFLPFPDDY